MKHRIIRHTASVLVALFVATSVAYAQDPAPDLQDLVGARGSSGEMALKERGYSFVKGEKSGSDSYTYWRQSRTGQCIMVRTAEGRYQSLVNAPDVDCQNGESAAEARSCPQHDLGYASRITSYSSAVNVTTVSYRCLVLKNPSPLPLGSVRKTTTV